MMPMTVILPSITPDKVMLSYQDSLCDNANDLSPAPGDISANIGERL